MTRDKDIRFTDKKVDSDWKKQVQPEPTPEPASSTEKPSQNSTTSKQFLNLLHSLGFQAMLHLGEIANPQTGQSELNLDAAREAMDLISAIKEKTSGNLSPEETAFFETVYPELQMKFAEKA